MYRNWISSYVSWLEARGIAPAMARTRATLAFTVVAVGNLGVTLMGIGKICGFAPRGGGVALILLLAAIGFASRHAVLIRQEVQKLAIRFCAPRTRSYAWLRYFLVSGAIWLLATLIVVKRD